MPATVALDPARATAAITFRPRFMAAAAPSDRTRVADHLVGEGVELLVGGRGDVRDQTGRFRA